MREYTEIITIKVIASVIAESKNDARELAFGSEWIDDDPDKPFEVWNLPPKLLHPQVIDLVAYSPMSTSFDGFKPRTFNEAACEISPDVEPEHQGRPVVFPPKYPGLPE